MSDGFDKCSTPGCDGDAHYAAPGKRHIAGCSYPMTAPDAVPPQAVEAATRAVIEAEQNVAVSTYAELAEAALAAAYPAIREAIAQEIEAIPYSPELEHGDNGEWMQKAAAATARGEEVPDE